MTPRSDEDRPRTCHVRRPLPSLWTQDLLKFFPSRPKFRPEPRSDRWRYRTPFRTSGRTKTRSRMSLTQEMEYPNTYYSLHYESNSGIPSDTSLNSCPKPKPDRWFQTPEYKGPGSFSDFFHDLLPRTHTQETILSKSHPLCPQLPLQSKEECKSIQNPHENQNTRSQPFHFSLNLIYREKDSQETDRRLSRHTGTNNDLRHRER